MKCGVDVFVLKGFVCFSCLINLIVVVLGIRMFVIFRFVGFKVFVFCFVNNLDKWVMVGFNWLWCMVRLVVILWLFFLINNFLVVIFWIDVLRLIFDMDCVEFLLMLLLKLMMIEGWFVVFFRCVVIMLIILGC